MTAHHHQWDPDPSQGFFLSLIPFCVMTSYWYLSKFVQEQNSLHDNKLTFPPPLPSKKRWVWFDIEHDPDVRAQGNGHREMDLVTQF